MGVHSLDISILPYICPYWTSTCFWFIEVTLTSIPVFWGVRIYAFPNLYSVNRISKGWKNRRKHRLTRVVRPAVYSKIKCRFGTIIQNPIWQNVLAVNYRRLKKQITFSYQFFTSYGWHRPGQGGRKTNGWSKLTAWLGEKEWENRWVLFSENSHWFLKGSAWQRFVLRLFLIRDVLSAKTLFFLLHFLHFPLASLILSIYSNHRSPPSLKLVKLPQNKI